MLFSLAGAPFFKIFSAFFTRAQVLHNVILGEMGIRWAAAAGLRLSQCILAGQSRARSKNAYSRGASSTGARALRFKQRSAILGFLLE